MAREQTEPGYEAQVDFGQYVMQTAYKRNVRIYYGLDRLNQEFIDWIDHDGNGMINVTTKKSPRELFKKDYSKFKNIIKKRSLEFRNIAHYC